MCYVIIYFSIEYDHLQFTASSVVSSLHDPSFETVCKFTLSAKFEYFTEILNYSCVLTFSVLSRASANSNLNDFECL